LFFFYRAAVEANFGHERSATSKLGLKVNKITKKSLKFQSIYFIQLVSIASVQTLYLFSVSMSSYGPPWSLKSKIACVPVAYILNINSIESLRMGIKVKINREVAI